MGTLKNNKNMNYKHKAATFKRPFGQVIAVAKVKKHTLLRLMIATVAVISVLFLSCGGGFGTDCDNAKDLGSGFFGPDSLRR
ncbi:MAG: hypothetical protein LBU70_09265 [Chitinispirillales bacterium]|jgi:hypothetical protein|nr:hypothetical protein [Chitinispirillales bacterium]